MQYIYTAEYCSGIKRNEIGSFVELWMVLTVLQSEVRKKNEYHMLIHIYGIQKWYRGHYSQSRNRHTEPKNDMWTQGREERDNRGRALPTCTVTVK